MSSRSVEPCLGVGPVEMSPVRSHNQNARLIAKRAGSPRESPPLSLQRFFKFMIDSETVTVDLLKASLPREQFADRVSVVSRALSTRASVLVLGGMQLRAADGRLELAATDMELSLRASVEADVAGEGTVVVPGRLLLDIARVVPGVRRHARAPARGVRPRDHERLCHLPHPHVLGRGLPAPARPRCGRAPAGRRRAAPPARSRASGAPRRATRAARSSPASS